MTAHAMRMTARAMQLMHRAAGRRWSARWLVALLMVLLPVGAMAEGPRIPIDPDRYEAAEEDAGIIEAIAFDGPVIRVNGTTYGFEPGAYVEVRGIQAAPTLLAPGMNVYLRFLLPNGKRQIIYLRQVADSAPTMAR